MTKNKDSTKKIFSHKIQQTCQIWPIWCFLESCAGKSKYFHNLFVKKISTFVQLQLYSYSRSPFRSMLQPHFYHSSSCFFLSVISIYEVCCGYIYILTENLFSKIPPKWSVDVVFFSWTPGSRWNYVVANAWNSFIGVELILTVKNRQSESVDLLRHNVENVKRWKIKWNRKGWLQLETNKPKSIELCENL